MTISDKRLFRQKYSLMQWSATHALPGLSITFVPTINARHSGCTVKKYVMLKNYIQC